jgi:tetratricopeptide (TPR) repeat protein
MKALCALSLAIFSVAIFAQSAAPSCPAERPVDDIVAEIHKLQSKKKHRVSNPLPDNLCIFGWCRNRPSTPKPPAVPESGRTAPEAGPAKNSSANESTSFRPAVDPCNEAMEKALLAAHDVEVGDEYFEDRNYNAALMRYKDADKGKPGDIAIHVRLGRAFEKLSKIPQAIDQYKAAQDLDGPAKWSDEAKAAVLRLQQQ